MYGYGYRGTFKPATTVWDADAQAYFDSIGDVPAYAKSAINQRILDLKSAGLWTNLKALYLFPPSNTMTGSIREARNNTVVGALANSGGANSAPLYLCLRALTGNQGLTCFSTGHFRTNLIPSTSLTLNDSAFSIVCQDQDATNAGYTIGALNSGTQNIIFQKRNGSGNAIAQMYNNTAGQGLVSVAYDGSGGNFIVNRTSNTSFKLYKNGSQIASSSSTGGSLPSLQMVINGYSTTGNGNGNTIGGVAIYGASLSAGQIASESASWQTFRTAMKRTGTYDASVLVDGDSHTVYWNANIVQQIMRRLDSYEINYQDFGVSGQTMATMIANDATNVYPKIVSGKGTYYLICGGGTNDASAGTSAATMYANLQTYISDAKANATGKGVTLKAVVMPLFNRPFLGDDAKVMVQSNYNDLVRSGWAGFADFFVEIPEPWSSKRSDYASDALYITAVRAFCANTTYFYDSTHLVSGVNGYEAIGDLIADEIIGDI